MRPAILISTLAIVATFLGCIGTDDGPDAFALCSNGVLDGSEECDDGNKIDGDDCLATCVFNRCGDEFVNTVGPENIEMCDGRSLNNGNCFNLGFLGGTLTCTSQCTFDTSACTPRPTPTGQVALGAFTPSPPPTPTATVP